MECYTARHVSGLRDGTTLKEAGSKEQPCPLGRAVFCLDGAKLRRSVCTNIVLHVADLSLTGQGVRNSGSAHASARTEQISEQTMENDSGLFAAGGRSYKSGRDRPQGTL